MDKYLDLKEQIEMETKWCIERINRSHPNNEDIPDDITLVGYLGKYKFLTDEEEGMMFAYLSIKSKVDMLEEERR